MNHLMVVTNDLICSIKFFISTSVLDLYCSKLFSLVSCSFNFHLYVYVFRHIYPHTPPPNKHKNTPYWVLAYSPSPIPTFKPIRLRTNINCSFNIYIIVLYYQSSFRKLFQITLSLEYLNFSGLDSVSILFINIPISLYTSSLK